MKIGRLGVKIIKSISLKNSKKNKKVEDHSIYKEIIDIPYKNDNKECHKFDLFFAKENRKDCLIIDIHGGAYIFGSRKDNFLFGTKFLEQGYDFVAIDYEVNNGKKDTLELIEDCLSCVSYIIKNKKELGIDYDKFVITGDSAGGHLALIVSELFIDKSIQKLFDVELPEMNLLCTLINCPVYDFENCGLNQMTEGGRKRLFGPDISSVHMKLLSPKTYFEKFNKPLFVSSCKNDFLLNESLSLKKDAELYNKENFKFVFIDSDEKEIWHVHNILNLDHELSKKVNNEMIDFINKYC